jgi:hypothetical protein
MRATRAYTRIASAAADTAKNQRSRSAFGSPSVVHSIHGATAVVTTAPVNSSARAAMMRNVRTRRGAGPARPPYP